jgi:hypothetical protein
VKACPRPLDPLDAEAIASGAEPVFAADAAAHARDCVPCQASIDAARSVSGALEGDFRGLEAPGGLWERVNRLRAFSSRERRTYALWNAPVLLTGGLFVSGVGFLALPALRATDQVSLWAAASLPLAGLARTAADWSRDLLRLAPNALTALSDGLRSDRVLGIAALALLLPISLGLRRVLSRATARR